jgi:hypothetical protein
MSARTAGCKALSFLIAVAIVAFGGPELRACSGPGAAKTIDDSIRIGSSLGGLSIAIAAPGCWPLLRRSVGHRVLWLVAPLVFHPGWWMSATHGDCGYALRLWSGIATVCIAVLTALVIVWPSRRQGVASQWRWGLGGALAGALVGIPLVAVVFGVNFGAVSVIELLVSASPLCSTIAAGTLIGRHLYRVRSGGARWFRFSLRTLLLLPIIVVPLVVVLLPFEEYTAGISSTSPFSFVVVDEQTGRPVANATVQVIDLRFPVDDPENQAPRVVTGADGSAPYYLDARVYGREGLLGGTETITYDPQMIRVEAAGYQLFYTSLESSPPVTADQLTALPLGLTFPPPPSVTIQLKPIASRAGNNGAGERRAQRTSTPAQ